MAMDCENVSILFYFMVIASGKLRNIFLILNVNYYDVNVLTVQTRIRETLIDVVVTVETSVTRGTLAPISSAHRQASGSIQTRVRVAGPRD